MVCAPSPALFGMNCTQKGTVFFPKQQLLGSLSRDAFERRTSTGSELFSLFICLDATKFVLLSVLTLIETIFRRIYSKSRPKNAKTPLPVDLRRSKKSLLYTTYQFHAAAVFYLQIQQRMRYLQCEKQMSGPQRLLQSFTLLYHARLGHLLSPYHRRLKN